MGKSFYRKHAKNLRDTSSELRTMFDGSDPFMAGGHQIVRVRQSEREIPEWTKSNTQIQRILLTAFPKLKTDLKHRKSAARWLRIIHLFYRSQLTLSQVADEMEEKRTVIKQIIQRIRLVEKGLTVKGKPRGCRPRGRPKMAYPISRS